MRRFGIFATIGIVAAAAVAVALPAKAAPTAPTAPTGTLTIYLKQDQREVLDLGVAGTTVGDVVTGSGNVSRTNGGAAVGTFVYRAEAVRVNIPGGIENRMSTLWITLPKGSIAATSLISVPQGTRPVAVHQYIIIGGTGAYAGARGTMGFKPLGPDDYRAKFRFIE